MSDILALSALEIVECNHEWFREIDDFESCKKLTEQHGTPQSLMLFYALRQWKKYKQIFVFGEELCDSLKENDGLSNEIPLEILNALPYQCLYIKLPKHYLITTSISTRSENVSENLPVDGFFVFIVENKLNFCILFENRASLNIYANLVVGKSLDEVLKDTMSCNKATAHIFNMFLQLVLYLCAANADVVKIKKPRKNKKGKAPITSERKIGSWQVGFRYGQVVRKRASNFDYESPNGFNDTQNEPAEKCGQPKRPHFRRGHFHHFWTGSQEKGDRKLILKWLSPILVNGDYENQSIAVIHKVVK